ncbi:MAG: hypothetical protein R3B74_14190 [Nitrospirales bacterium]|nr:hypothetical protein [Nitrospirales bacterium]
MKLPAQVFHLAEAANWPSIQQHGLLSTSALLDLAGVRGNKRAQFEQRPRSIHIELPNGVQVRDQKPMLTQALARCLIGISPVEWYGLLNSKVYFWLDPARLDRQRRACDPRPQVVLAVDTKRLLATHAQRIALSPINTGNARRRPAVRGRSTFVPYAMWCKSGWCSEAVGLGTRTRARSHRPVELTVDGAVPNIMDLIIQVYQIEPRESFCVKRNIRAAVVADRAGRGVMHSAMTGAVFPADGIMSGLSGHLYVRSNR